MDYDNSEAGIAIGGRRQARWRGKQKVQEAAPNGLLFGGEYYRKGTQIHKVPPLSTGKKEEHLRVWLGLRKDEQRER